MPDPEENQPGQSAPKVHFQTGRIRPISDRSPQRVQSEESLRVLRSLGSECCQTYAAKVGNECGGLANEGGFAAFGMVWCRRERRVA